MDAEQYAYFTITLSDDYTFPHPYTTFVQPNLNTGSPRLGPQEIQTQT